jgi:hypothetical protein
LQWFIAELLVFTWKGLVGWPSDGLIFAFEIVALCLTLTLEYIRLEIAARGNMTEQLFLAFIALVLTLISLAAYLYWTLWQWLVLTIDVILGCTQLALCLFELILILATLLTFCKRPAKEKTN